MASGIYHKEVMLQSNNNRVQNCFGWGNNLSGTATNKIWSIPESNQYLPDPGRLNKPKGYNVKKIT
ncbi:hypothetical protein BB560_003333 [Smittium megazygosporum]|uniref:Uncharacterized protein n=1 Tax=Smittium megazygosporum TaxID=133381 RepID=A0A2T9ZCF2_9FUNG|nr:hypothetical protein BB560_003333 [Smittium megazygosporum]